MPVVLFDKYGLFIITCFMQLSFYLWLVNQVRKNFVHYYVWGLYLGGFFLLGNIFEKPLLFVLLSGVQVSYISLWKRGIKQNIDVLKEYNLYVFYMCMLQAVYCLLCKGEHKLSLYVCIFFIIGMGTIAYLLFLKYKKPVKENEQITFFADVVWLFLCIIVVIFISVYHWILVKDSKNMEKEIGYTLFFTAFFILLLYRFLQKEIVYHKQKRELDLYKRYSPMTHLMIEEIRENQHDFKNHLQTIVSLTVTCSNYEELCEEIRRYGRVIKKDLDYSQLFKIKNKLILGMIYSKMKEAEAKSIFCGLNKINLCSMCKIPDYEMVRIIGSLFDNAMEAEIETQNNLIEISLNQNRQLVFQIKNQHPKLSNTFLDKMWEKGVTTKNTTIQSRGIGLYAVKKIVKKYNGSITTYNEEIEQQNYICIKIVF